MEIINYSGKKSYNTSGVRKNILRRGNNRSQYSSSAIVAPRNYGAKNFLMMLKESFLLLLKTILHIIEFAWIIPAAIACVYFPRKSVEEYAYKESFANPVEVATDNDWAIEYLNSAMSTFAMETEPSFDSLGFLVEADGTSAPPKVYMMQAVTYDTYTFRSGDTISAFLKRCGLKSVSTLISVNDIADVTTIPAGKKFKVPSMDGIIHTVASGDTLEKLVRKYSTAKNPITVNDLLDVNNLDSATLSKGQQIFIPGGVLSEAALEKAMGEHFVNPLKAKYYLSSPFGTRKDPISGVTKKHTGIDMACPTGTPIYASMSGTVDTVGYNSTYGNYVIITHKDHYQTLYAHMSKALAVKGTRVTQGEKIGLVGSTGYSTGPHLHFTVYKNGNLVDPLTLIKK